MKSACVVVPVSGLGNRMRVVASVSALARARRQPLVVVWLSAWDCRAPFDRLFEPVDEPYLTLLTRGILYTPATKNNLFLPYLLRRLRGYTERRAYRPCAPDAFPRLLDRSGRLYVDTCYSLYPYPVETLRRLFRPVPSLLSRIDSLARRFTPRTIGVHIRRADNRQSILRSPLSLFRARIDQLLDAGEADLIYLATDDLHVKDYLRSRYGARLLTLPRKADRHTPAGMDDAVVDLYALSRTTHIFGSYYSSFSETAAELSGVPLTIVSTPEP